MWATTMRAVWRMPRSSCWILQPSRSSNRYKTFVPVDFPYIPGLLSFREIPAILVALAQLSAQPDLLMVDGQGIAHPRRMGIAAHLGVHLDRPAIGVAKSRLTGDFAMPGPLRGDHTPLMAGQTQIGTVLRSRDGVSPLFISPGHRMDQATALAYTLHCLGRHRLPEPTRLADKYSKCGKAAVQAKQETGQGTLF